MVLPVRLEKDPKIMDADEVNKEEADPAAEVRLEKKRVEPMRLEKISELVLMLETPTNSVDPILPVNVVMDPLKKYEDDVVKEETDRLSVTKVENTRLPVLR